MGGTQIGTGSVGAGLGYSGKAPANMTPGVTNAATGKFEQFDPMTMASTTAAGPAAQPALTGAGMSSTGVPSYVSNFLQQGGRALSMPTMRQNVNMVSDPGKLYRAPSVPVNRPATTTTPATGGTSSTSASGVTPAAPGTPAAAAGTPAPKTYGTMNTATLDAMSDQQLATLVTNQGVYGSINNPAGLGITWQDMNQLPNYLADRLGAGRYTNILSTGRMLMPPAGPTNNPSWWGGSNR